MLQFSNSKINLGLYIINKRDDGFHNLETIFYPINLKDAIEIIETNDDFQFTNSGIVVDSKIEENLIFKAYKLLKDVYNLPNIKIHLHKIIPFGAGLGGGSANAANTIILLNKMFDLKLTEFQQIDFVKKLGSDCAFFIKNKPVFAYEKGDVFEEINLDLSDYKIVLIKPSFGVNTKQAYSNVKIEKPEQSLKQIIELPINQWKNILKNNFEINIFKLYPELNDLKQMLYNKGAIYASMSGSGSSIFGIFEKNCNINIEIKNCFIWQGNL